MQLTIEKLQADQMLLVSEMFLFEVVNPGQARPYFKEIFSLHNYFLKI